MKRWSLRIAIVLVVGVVLNLAATSVLWFKGERPPPPSPNNVLLWQEASMRDRDLDDWRSVRKGDWPESPEYVREFTAFGLVYRQLFRFTGPEVPAIATPEQRRTVYEQRDLYDVKIAAVGWPLQWQRTVSASHYDGLNPVKTEHGALLVGRFFLPERVMWRNAIANSVLYGAIVAALWGTALLTRRTIRRARGGCPACGYRIAGHSEPGCPECGWRRG